VTVRAVFLDRDGVINRAVVREGKPYPPQCLEDLEVLPGVQTALQRLQAAGFKLFVVTNQPDVARGSQTRAVVEAMHQRLADMLPIDEFFACYHDGDGCNCRKPKPGALLELGHRHDVDLPRSFMIGDRWRDVAAGQRAGCRCYFIDCGYDERQPESPYVRVESLLDAVDHILGKGVSSDERVTDTTCASADTRSAAR
jgi:D-glycero-D-manno-heptose 1,7-bisphosphate phosphatase